MVETNEQRANRWYSELMVVEDIQQRFKLADTFFKELADESDDRIVIATMQTIIKSFNAPSGGSYVPVKNHKWFGKLVKRYSDRLIHEDPELVAIIKECRQNGFNIVNVEV
jgi:hypothetical protein